METYQDIMSPTPLRKNMVPHTTKGKKQIQIVKSKDNDFGLSLLGSFRKVKKDGKLGRQSQGNRFTGLILRCVPFLALAGGWGAKTGLYSRKVSTVPVGVFTTIGDKYVSVVPTAETCLDAMGFPRDYYEGVYTYSKTNKKKGLTKEAKYKGIGNSGMLP